MGLWQRLLGSEQPPVTEATAGPAPDDVERHGYEYGVPMGGVESDERARAAAGTRQQVMEQLYQAYLACSPAAACVDTTARMVTAGGLQLVPEDGDEDQERPPAIQHLDQLMKRTNPQEDLIQLLRSTITDQLVFGDGFVEVTEVAGVPAALWTLDGTTMTVKCDEHGVVSGFYQQVDGQRNATFDPDEVIHISLDSPRGGIYGVSPMQKLMVPITAWLFTAAVLKEYMRQGAPPRIAVDLGKDTKPADAERWRQEYMGRNLGPRNQGKPLVTRVHQAGQAGPPPIHELTVSHVADLLATLNDLRDQIISGFGMTPAMVGVIESGNLGGGTGESQARTFHYGTVLPLQNLLLEKLNYRLLTAQGVTGWMFQFGEMEYRDSQVVENIRDQRLRNGSWTLNRYRAEIGEEPVEGGQDPVLVDRQNLVLWSDIATYSKSMIDKNEQSAISGGFVAPERPAAPNAAGATAAPSVGNGGDAAGSQESIRASESASRAWREQYAAQLHRLRRELVEAGRLGP